MSTPKLSDLEFIGYDLGHGETALGRAYGSTVREPEILEFRGQRSFVTAVAKTKGEIKLGADAVNLSLLDNKAQVWVKFKSRDLDKEAVKLPTQLFTKALMKGLTSDGAIQGLGKSQFIVGCPSGWTPGDRASYQTMFRGAGLKQVRIVPESRAALMTALEQGYLSMDDARSSVLIVDIGSSTTDFTYCFDLEAQDVGHNILGSGLLDSLIFEINLARQKERKKIDQLIARYPHYRPIMEYWCREAKEAFFTGEDTPVELLKRLPIGRGVLFEIRIDKADAQEILSRPLDALNGYSWQGAFEFALKETIDNLGKRAPDTVLLTGGASRLPLVFPSTQKAFPKARVVRGAEPEFAIARGLAWLGRFEYLHTSFKSQVLRLTRAEGDITQKADAAARSLGATLSPVLVDAVIESCILPTFREWRSGKIASLDQVEHALNVQVKSWLQSDAAKATLRPVINRWFAGLQRDIETLTDPLCRDHGLPAMVLSLDDSQHVSRHLEGLSVSAPNVASLESDTALIGTTLSAVLIGALLAKANLFAPLFLNPIGIVVGGLVTGGGFFFGRKALAGKFRQANVPVIARQLLTDGRVRAAALKQRPELISAVQTAWEEAASERFSQELTDMLGAALTERADERAVLFLV
ncbi:Hsp70 family protein [Litorimonas sp. RW-G-Af-16]|uniref:Hsp70 family protein n=1 Tax=Litorimonas sp. RW-G-Af-16 TaxID=3241168 RepID=UPI00390C609C